MTDGIQKSIHTPKRGIAVGVASSGRACPVSWAISMATQVYPVNTNLAWINVVGQSIDDARERIVEEAQRANLKYLWFIDDDTVPPTDAARKLMYLLDQAEASDSKVMVVGGIYCVKHDPPTPLVFKNPGEGPFWKWKIGEVFDVWGIGTGCMMINMDVFKHLEKPYFKTSSDIGYSETDDLFFCNKVINAGFKIQAHGGILCEHWDLNNNLIYTLPKNSYPNLPLDTSP